jgi:GNAT superfamily N-acetyltransferase
MPTVTNELKELMGFEVEYACFNGSRSLSRLDPGQTTWEKHGDDILISNSNWLENTYLNRLCLANSTSLHDQNIDLTHNRIDVFGDVDSRLLGGHTHAYTLHFYHRELSGEPPNKDSNPTINIELCTDGENFIKEIERAIGTAINPEIASAKAHYYCTEQFRCYVALRANEVVGIATLFIAGDKAWFANAFTHREHRGRGVQSALLQSRVNDCVELGVKHAFTDVESDSASERNVRRFGFDCIAAASVWEA